jgi:hypothetical protein
MGHDDSPDLGKLGRQSLRRPLSDAEARLATVLEQIFASGRHDFADVAAGLRERASDPWSVESLEAELRLINASFDDAYAGKRPASPG